MAASEAGTIRPGCPALVRVFRAEARQAQYYRQWNQWHGFGNMPRIRSDHGMWPDCRTIWFQWVTRVPAHRR